MGLTDETSKQLFQEDAHARADVFSSESNERHPELHEALDHERELYLDLANALPLGIYRLRVYHDVGTIADRWSSLIDAPYAIEFVNERFCEIVNIEKQTFINNPAILHGYLHEDDIAEFIQRNVEANLYTIPFSWEGKFIKDRQTIWIHFESIPRVLENKDILWTGFLEDITERKKAEEELHQLNQELQQLNSEKDKFFSIIAHDLKSPFNSIMGFSGMLLDKINQQEKNFAEIKHYAEIIRSSSERSMNLLYNLMQWSQAQTGRMNFNPEHFDLTALTDEIVQLYESIASQKSIQLTKVTPDNLRIYADKAMISTVIRNLVSNAIKFTPKGGTIQIITSTTADMAAITVRDSGVGMTQAVMDRIFHIDSSYSSPDTNGEKGTGLGLLLCKEFIDTHKGTIRIDSELGNGSEFTATIPLNPQILLTST